MADGVPTLLVDTDYTSRKVALEKKPGLTVFSDKGTDGGGKPAESRSSSLCMRELPAVLATGFASQNSMDRRSPTPLLRTRMRTCEWQCNGWHRNLGVSCYSSGRHRKEATAVECYSQQKYVSSNSSKRRAALGKDAGEAGLQAKHNSHCWMIWGSWKPPTIPFGICRNVKKAGKRCRESVDELQRRRCGQKWQLLPGGDGGAKYFTISKSIIFIRRIQKEAVAMTYQ